MGITKFLAPAVCAVGLWGWALAWGADATAPPATAPAKIRLLIIDGLSNHNWKLNTKLLRAILEPSGLFDVAVSTAPAKKSGNWDAWRPKFSDYDVILQTYNNTGGGPDWPEPIKKDFVSFVKNGGGVFIYHSANNAFVNWPEYNEIMGLGWRKANFGTALLMSADGSITRLPPGQGSDTNRGPRVDVVVHTLNDHPIHAGFPSVWKSPQLEVYCATRGPAKNVEVISYGEGPHAGEYWPLEWVVTYGEGRAYVSSFGHCGVDDTEAHQPVNMLAADEQTLIPRVIQWLAKRPITVPVPADFPTADKTSLRPPFVLSN